MSFAGALQHTIDYVNAAIDDDGTNRAAVLQQQVDHLVSVFRNRVPATDDATKALGKSGCIRCCSNVFTSDSPHPCLVTEASALTGGDAAVGTAAVGAATTTAIRPVKKN